MFCLQLLLYIIIIALAQSSIPGGWSPVDVNDPDVINAANFAISQQFPDQTIEYKIVQAFEQVVAGINYCLTLFLHNVNNIHCQIDHAIVYDRFGTYNLTCAQIVSQHCEYLRRRSRR